MVPYQEVSNLESCAAEVYCPCGECSVPLDGGGMGTCSLQEGAQAAGLWDVDPKMAHELGPCRVAAAGVEAVGGLDHVPLGTVDQCDILQPCDASGRGQRDQYASVAVTQHHKMQMLKNCNIRTSRRL